MAKIKVKKMRNFHPEKDFVLEESLWRTDKILLGISTLAYLMTHFTSHSYHWTPIGFLDDIKNWKIGDLRQFHKKFYRPDNAILVVAGDVNESRVFESAQKYFGGLKNPKVDKNCSIFNTFKPTEPPRDSSKRVYLKKDNNSVDMVAIAFDIPNFKSKDQVGLSVLSEILSNGKSSRLYKKLVEEKRIATMVYGYNMELKDKGVFIFLAMANPNSNAKELEKSILEEIEKLKSGDISERTIL